MKRLHWVKLLVLLAAFMSAAGANAQGLERPMAVTPGASQVYFELGGPGIIYSFNFDTRFGKYENGAGFRIGLGGASVDGDGYLAIPFQFNYLAGNRGKYLELGAGATYAPGLELFDDNANTYGTLTVGFRKQPVGKKGFTFRAAFTPVIGFQGRGSFLPFAGVSFGYRF